MLPKPPKAPSSGQKGPSVPEKAAIDAVAANDPSQDVSVEPTSGVVQLVTRLVTQGEDDEGVLVATLVDAIREGLLPDGKGTARNLRDSKQTPVYLREALEGNPLAILVIPFQVDEKNYIDGVVAVGRDGRLDLLDTADDPTAYAIAESQITEAVLFKGEAWLKDDRRQTASWSTCAPLADEDTVNNSGWRNVKLTLPANLHRVPVLYL